MTKSRVTAGLCQCGCGTTTGIAKRNDARRGCIHGQPMRFAKGHQARRGLLPFNPAREFVRTLRLNSVTKWNAYCKSGNKPKTLPTAPYRVYRKDWAGWGDFLGNEFLSFGEAREFVRGLQFKSESEWRVYARSAKKPNNIPSDPARRYAKGWAGWGDFLGTGNIRNGDRVFLSFTEAREHVRSLGLKSQTEWHAYCIGGNKPENIPTNPQRIYRSEWLGWADWLGYLGASGNWTTQALGAFLRSIASEIPNMRDASLVALITEVGLDVPLRQILRTPSLARVIAALRENGDGVLDRLRQQGERRFEGRRRELPVVEDEDFAHDEVEVNEDNIHVADRLKGIASPECIEHLIQEKLNGLIVKYINGDKDVSRIVQQKGREFYREIRRRFENEVRGVMGIDTSEWKLRDKRTGKPTQPNLMQRYIAHKIKTSRVWCNWSGTGAGKTGSAGLASYVIGSRLTVVLCPNATVKQWVEELTNAFPHSTSATNVADIKKGKGSFLILNYEKFQSEKSSPSLVRAIVELRPDFVVLDEIQLVKRRGQDRTSIRREELLGMLQQLPNTRVLGMTATPVINELAEGVSLLEAVTGKKHDLKTFGSISNALRLHFALLQHGLRYKPEYQQSLSIKVEPFVQNAALPALRRIAQEGTNDVLAIEQTILPAKLEHVRDWIKPGTLIYLEFVEGMVPVVRRYVESLGFSVGEYIGNTRGKDRDGLKEKFIEGEVDVLIGSQPVALGVDGLQKRCNRLIVLSLPWTHAAFQQLYGRLYRQGSDFGEVEVLIPQVVTTAGGERWSWDEARYSVIENKKTLSDAATDGYVPTSEHLSRKEFAKKAMNALRAMIEGVHNEADLEIVASTTGTNGLVGQDG
jgi:superfamily II DNA or RNA helicase